MSTTNTASRPRFLAVGAFERDNFGDLLYPLLLEALLQDRFSVELGVPVEPLENEPTVGRVRSWAELLEENHYAAVWVAGGEVGSTPPEYAYMTRFGRDAHEELLGAEPADYHAQLRAAMAGHLLDPPYIPRLSGFGDNAATPLIVSSVGVAGIASEPAWRRPLLHGALREASAVSVRDRRSAEVLSDAGIDHVCAPDLAHLVAEIRPVTSSPHGAILVHVSDQALEAHGATEWARGIEAALADDDGEIRLFLAGLAPGHDSLETAEALRAEILALSPVKNVTISTARGVWDRVEEIAGARMWIGGSLHGRIVASAYGVPRVSFKKPKVDNYARDWDADMPHGVVPDDLPTAVRAAFAAATEPAVELARQARENLDAMVSALDAAGADSPGVLRRRLTVAAGTTENLREAARLATRELQEAERAVERTVERAEAGRVRDEERNRSLEVRLRETSAELTAANGMAAQRAKELDTIRGSTRWLLFERLDRVRDRVRRLVSRR